MRWSALVPLLVLVLLTIALWRGLGRDPTFVPSPLIDRPAPAFDLPGVAADRPRITAGDLRGQITLVNFWGTWCPGCHVEHGLLLALARDGVRIVGIAFWDEPAAVQEWLLARGDPYAGLGIDLEGRTAIDWGVYGAPETFVIDRDGKVRAKHVGPLTQEYVATQLMPLLAQLQREGGT
jgi:cytochrome c biogenesis protein CcmG/thiol:disulfide interchange protein DsbE